MTSDLDGAVQAAQKARTLVAALAEISTKARKVGAMMELFGRGPKRTINKICLDLRAASDIALSICHTFNTGIAVGISDALMDIAESQNLSDVQEFRAFLSGIELWSEQADFLCRGIEGIVRRGTTAQADAPPDGSSRGDRIQARRLAERLLAFATRCLPEVHRERYVEEFRGELWSVAEAGGRLRSQVAYAVRQIARAMLLRRELKSRHHYRAVR
jgi:hypothetical protein